MFDTFILIFLVKLYSVKEDEPDLLKFSLC